MNMRTGWTVSEWLAHIMLSTSCSTVVSSAGKRARKLIACGLAEPRLRRLFYGHEALMAPMRQCRNGSCAPIVNPTWDPPTLSVS